MCNLCQDTGQIIIYGVPFSCPCKTQQSINMKNKLKDKTNKINEIDREDWNERPVHICKGCGSHRNTCTCSYSLRKTDKPFVPNPSLIINCEL